MGYLSEDAVFEAVQDVVGEVAHKLVPSDIERIVAMHPWARNFVSPRFAAHKTLRTLARSDYVVDRGTLSPKEARRCPGRVKIEIGVGRATFTFIFQKSEAGEYEYHNYSFD